MPYSKPTKIVSTIATALLLWALTGCAVAQQSSDSSTGKVLAEVNGVQLTAQQVEEAAEADLETLQMQKLEFEAKQRKQRHEILRGSLDRLVADKLFAAEAEAQGVSRQELLKSEIEDRITDPSQEEIDQIYEINKARLRRSKEDSRSDIVRFLRTQRSSSLRRAFVDRLRDKYGVKDFLEPLRFDLESDGHPASGPAQAPITLVEFADFECPYCSRMAETLNQVQERYGDKVRRIYRQFPLNQIHPNAQKAAEASLCASEQGRFWEMYGRLFEEPRRLGLEALNSKAAEVGLDLEKFDSCLTSGRFAEQVRQDRLKGVSIGVSGTPAVFINGRPAQISLELISQMIDEELEKKGK